MKAELRDALRQLTEAELLEVRDYVDRLLARLRAEGVAPRSVPEGVRESRRFERYSVDLPISYLPHSAARRRSGPALRRATARDVSRRGVRFVAGERLRVGERISLYLPRPAGTKKLLAEVCWSRPCEDGFECGARFVGLEDLLDQRTGLPGHCAVVLACDPGPRRAALRNLLVKDGYYVVEANGVPEAASTLHSGEPVIMIGTPDVFLAEGERLARACEDAGERAVTIVLREGYEPSPETEALVARCHDHIANPDRPAEVLVVVERAWRRLAAAAGRRPGN